MNLRPYQSEAVDAVFEYWEKGGGNPLINMATGLGKSLCVSDITRTIRERFPDYRVLMLVHVKELVRQNFETLLRAWPGAPVGVYSAGLGKRDTRHPVTFASIQSVYKRAKALGPRDVVIIDEAHLTPREGEGRYLRLLHDLREMVPDMRVCGLTATPFRLDSGRLDRGEDRLFDDIVYNYGIGEGVRDGWLAPLSNFAGVVEYDVGNVKRAGGEFVSSDLQAKLTASDHVLQAACDEIVLAGADRKSWLLFAAGVEHAAKVEAALHQRGIAAATVTGDTPADERDRLTREFKSGKLRALVNVQVLTTGFDAPGTDLIALLRPTLSTGLYVQMMGRGTRPDGVDLNSLPNAAARRAAIAASSKPNCRVLDYAGNIRRHGPVDAIVINTSGDGKGDTGEKAAVTDVKTKRCEGCGEEIVIQTRICPVCGFECSPPKHEAVSDKSVPAMMYGAPPATEGVKVSRWEFSRHEKAGADLAPPTLRVNYYAGLTVVPEWIAMEHAGKGRERANEFWRQHGGANPIPTTVDEAIARKAELTMPSTVTLQSEGKWLRVIDRGFATPPKKAQRVDYDPKQSAFVDPFADEIPF